jgi:hypothetical protein
MTPKLCQLYALRAQVDALILGEEAESQNGQPPVVDQSACPHCGAPEDKLQDTSTLDGTKRTRCSVCRQEWEL